MKNSSKKLKFAAAAALLVFTVSLAACSGVRVKGHTHTFAETWSSDETGHWHAATCDHADEREGFSVHSYQNGVCTECNYAHQNHTYVGGTCSVCGKLLYSKSADETKLYFGEYPQTAVTDDNDPDGSLRTALGAEAGSEPTADDAGKWTDYGYYDGGDVKSYMWYIDVAHQANRYRGVYFSSYRPEDTALRCSSGAEFSNQDDNGYDPGTVYWFKYEPVEWRILAEEGGAALLMASIILDCQQYYYEDSGTRTIEGQKVYLNNYAESDIRTWLNEAFYETAFGEAAQQIVKQTEVDNSAATTASPDSNSYACANTEDRVFLLSYQDILDPAYGFPADKAASELRQMKATDYAMSQGIVVNAGFGGASWWWLRSPRDDRNFVSYVHESGDTNTAGCVNVYGGVVPALWVRL